MMRMLALVVFHFLALSQWPMPAWAQGLGGEGGRVAIHARNPRYLQDQTGQPMVIIGYGNEVKNSPSVLDQLQGKVNYQRVYAAIWRYDESPNAYHWGRPWPTVHGKADMDAWNETYWRNLRHYIESARDRSIIVGLTIWDGHSDLPGGKFGRHSVWNARYNHQGVQWAYDARALERFPTPRSDGHASERLVYYQRRWIDRLISEIRQYPNVIIELDNETDQASESWWLWWADYFTRQGDFIIATTWNEHYTISDATFAQSRLLQMKSYHTRSEAVLNPQRLSWNKVIVVDADNTCSNMDATSARKIAWKSFINGGHWNDFVCYGKYFPDMVKVQHSGHLLNFIKSRAVPFAEMDPNVKLVSHGTILVKPGFYYLAYTEKEIELNLSDAAGFLNYEWYNPRTGAMTGSGKVEGGGIRRFQPPMVGDFALWVHSDNVD
jgi:hypothetical protein